MHDLFDDFCTCFNDADAVIVADIYSAGEEPIKGVEKEDLVAGLIQAGHKQAMICLLYTSDAADERSSVDLGGRRIIKKKKTKKKKKKTREIWEVDEYKGVQCDTRHDQADTNKYLG